MLLFFLLPIVIIRDQDINSTNHALKIGPAISANWIVEFINKELPDHGEVMEHHSTGHSGKKRRMMSD